MSECEHINVEYGDTCDCCGDFDTTCLDCGKFIDHLGEPKRWSL